MKSGECTHSQNDKSDLDSLNSEYFKNSSHQNEADVTAKVRLYQNHKNHKRKNNPLNKAIIRYQENSQSSAFPESTTSITDTSSSTSNQSDNESSCKLTNEEGSNNCAPNKSTPGVIVYDTVYLSSEESSEDHSSVLCKPPIIISAVEKKLKRFSDYTKVAPKNILSNLSFINNIETKTNDNQYYSLPDCNISQSLNISEKIDDNLRSSYNFQFPVEKTLEKLNNKTYDSNNRKKRSQSPDEISTSIVKETLDNSSNVTIIVTDEQDNIIENTSTITTNIQILDVKKDIRSNSLRKNSIQSKSRGIQKSIVRAQSFKTMSRPQILQIFDTKRKLSHSSNNDEFVKAEFLDKVSSVKKFWSTLSDEPESPQQHKPIENISIQSEIKGDPNPESLAPPSIEIININDRKKPTSIDSEISNNDTEPLFDHVRYKVLKSNAIRNNIIVRNKKDINYGGLLQYLQEYRFQELLANNNVVIVEPIRTKVDTRTASKKRKPAECLQKVASIENENSTKKKNVKKHFFYQPIQVNREMYEDELPSPDIVRNTKKIFEREIPSILSANHPNKTFSSSSDNLDLGSRINFHQTFYNQDSSLKRLSDTKTTSKDKWDAFSVSSGISSGKHSPPCDCVFADEKFNENSEEIVKSNIDLSNYKPSIKKDARDSHTAHYISEVIYNIFILLFSVLTFSLLK